MSASWNTVTDAAWRLATTPSPTPSLQIDPNDVTPGPAGFFIIALIAVAVFLIVFDMQRRIRRVNHRAEIRERLQVELDERDGVRADSDTDDTGTDTDPSSGPRPGERPL